MFIVNEIFPAIQGEGNSLGKAVTFIRFFGCNLKCPFCDSMYSVEGKDYSNYSTNSLIKEIPENCSTLVFTGGEPLLQLSSYEGIGLVTHLLDHLNIEIETNGIIINKFIDNYIRWTEDETYYNDTLGDISFNVSPKFYSDGKFDWRKAYKHANFQPLLEYDNVNFKFVLENKSEQKRKDCIKNIREFIDMHIIPYDRVWIMTEGQTQEEQSPDHMKRDIQLCLKNNWNYSPRLHVIVFSDLRGV